MYLNAMVALFFWGVMLVIALWIFFQAVRFIPNNRIGIVEKRFSGKGSLKSGLIALQGEAGFQPKVLRGGLHLLIPFQYRVHTVPLITIPQGKIGYVFARDGLPLEPAQAMAIQEQVRAYGGPRFQVTQQVMNRFSEAIEKAKVDVVPRVLISGRGEEGSQGGGTGSVLEALLTLLLTEHLGEPVKGAHPDGQPSPEVEAIRQQIRESLSKPKVDEPKTGDSNPPAKA